MVTPKHNCLQDPLETEVRIGKARGWPTGKTVPGIILGSSENNIIALII